MTAPRNTRPAAGRPRPRGLTSRSARSLRGAGTAIAGGSTRSAGAGLPGISPRTATCITAVATTAAANLTGDLRRIPSRRAKGDASCALERGVAERQALDPLGEPHGDDGPHALPFHLQHPP